MGTATKKKAETKTPAKPGKQPEVTRRGAKVVTIGTPAEPVHGKLGAKWCDRGNRGDRVLVIKERVADVLATKRVYDKTVPGYVDKPVRQAMWACDVVSGENRSCHDSTAHTMKRVFIRDDNLGRLFVPYAVKHPPKPEELLGLTPAEAAVANDKLKSHQEARRVVAQTVRAFTTPETLRPGARPPAGDGGCVGGLAAGLPQCTHDPRES